MKKFAALFICFALCAALFSGCSGGKTRTFSYYIDEIPVSFDPQTASTVAEITVVTNIFEGLFRKNLDGEIEAAAAKDYTVSDDGLKYTITLKSGLHYNYGFNSAKKKYTAVNGDIEGVPLTAQDFEFALQRVFMPQTESPWVDTFSAVKSSKAVLNGADIETLGVKAIDDTTLEITLEYPDPEFITKLCSAGAMPCNKQFFYGTHGAYGLYGDYINQNILSNGEYSVTVWNNEEGITLRREVSDNALINRVRLVTPDYDKPESAKADDDWVAPTPEQRLADGKSNGEILTAAKHDDYSETEFCTSVWVLAINCRKDCFANDNIRKGLGDCIVYNGVLPDSSPFLPANGLVPPSVTLFDKSYRDYCPNAVFAADNGAQSYRNGLTELTEAGVIDSPKLSGIVLLAPDTPQMKDLANSISQIWQRDLSAFFSIKLLPQTELTAAVESGDYDLAIYPVNAAENDVYSVLSRFSSQNTGNITGAEFPEFDLLLEQIRKQPDMQNRLSLYNKAESSLLSYHAVVPLCFEPGCFALSGAKNVVINPFGPILDFKWAEICDD